MNNNYRGLNTFITSKLVNSKTKSITIVREFTGNDNKKLTNLVGFFDYCK